jgi:hypothetical protein
MTRSKTKFASMDENARLRAIESNWHHKSTENAIAGARSVISDSGAIRPGTPVGSLSDLQWGWVIAAVVFAWVQTRAEQATTQGLETEQAIRLLGLVIEPWDAGAVASILPKLADDATIDWKKSLADWSRDEMTSFLTKAFTLIDHAIIARDIGGGITKKSDAAVLSREANAAAGGPLMTPDELDQL